MKKSCSLIFAGVLMLFLGIGIVFCLKIYIDKFDIGNFEWQNHSDGTISLEYGGVNYFFDEQLFNKKQALTYIEKIEQVFEHMDNVYQTERKNINLYAGFDKEVNKSNAVTIQETSNLDFDEIWKIVKSTYLEVINSAEQYGELYRYCVQRKIIQADLVDADKVNEALKDYFDDYDNLIYLDFTLPMLETVYFTAEQAEMTRKAVKAFTGWYADNYSQDELKILCKGMKEEDKNRLTTLKNEWLDSIGSKSVYSEYGKIFFQYNDYQGSYTNELYKENTAYATYKIENEDAIWLWDDEDVINAGYIEMIGNYMEMEPLRCFDFAEAREYLKEYIPPELEKVKICTSFVKSVPPEPSEYISAMNTIVIRYGWADVARSLLHEYIHHLTCGNGKILEKNSYLDEWFPTLLETFELENRECSKLLEYNDGNYVETIKEMGYWDEKQDKYSLSLGRMRYTLEQHFLRERNGSEEAGNEIYNVSVSELTYAQRAVMAKYIVDQYGLEKLVELAHGEGDFRDVFGITFQQLYFDMIDWLKLQLEDDEWLQQKLKEEGYNLQI